MSVMNATCRAEDEVESQRVRRENLGMRGADRPGVEQSSHQVRSNFHFQDSGAWYGNCIMPSPKSLSI